MSYMLTNKTRAVLDALQGLHKPVCSKELAELADKSDCLEGDETVNSRGINALVNNLVRRGLAVRTEQEKEDGKVVKVISATKEGMKFDVDTLAPEKESASTAF